MDSAAVSGALCFFNKLSAVIPIFRFETQIGSEGVVLVEGEVPDEMVLIEGAVHDEGAILGYDEGVVPSKEGSITSVSRLLLAASLFATIISTVC